MSRQWRIFRRFDTDKSERVTGEIPTDFIEKSNNMRVKHDCQKGTHKQRFSEQNEHESKRDMSGGNRDGFRFKRKNRRKFKVRIVSAIGIIVEQDLGVIEPEIDFRKGHLGGAGQNVLKMAGGKRNHFEYTNSTG